MTTPCTTRAAQRASTVAFKALGKAFATSSGSRAVLADIDLNIAAGEVIVILGASGCGKSTLLRLAGGLDIPTTGITLIDDTPAQNFDPRCAMGFQEPRLLPWRTVQQNVALGLPQRKSHSHQNSGTERVNELIDLVGLTDFAAHKPREVSGGMAQRTSLARALARNPGVLLLDEPFGALDALTRIKMQDLLLEIHAAEPTTIVLVTHDVDEALQLADRIITLGKPSPDSPATIMSDLTVPGERPRERSSQLLAELRDDLLEQLGVQRHLAH